MKRIVLLGLTLAAVLAFTVSAVGAKAKPQLILKIKGGAALKAGAVLEGSAPGLTTTTSAGNLECSTNIITLTLEKNEQTKADTAKVTQSVDTGEEEEPAKKCKTTSPLGAVKISVQKLPWAQSFSVKKTGEIKKVEFTGAFKGEEIKCGFEASKIKETFETGKALEIKVTKQKLKAAKGSTGGCPKTGTLEGTYKVTSEGKEVEAELT